MKKFVLALLAICLFTTGQALATHPGVFHHQVYHNNSVTIRSFSFANPIYSRTDAYFTFTPFNLVALPPVATFAAPAPCPQVQAPPPAADPAPTVTYAAPAPIVYSSS